MKKIYNWLANFVQSHALSIVFGFLLLSVSFYLIEFHHGTSSDQTVWGTFGDYINGITAPIIGIIGVILTYTILNNQNVESNQSEFKFMFETLFHSTEKQIEKISFKKGRKTYYGREAIEMLNNHIKGLIDYYLHKGNSINESVKKAFMQSLEDSNYSFPAYMKNLHNCLKIIDLHCNEKHKRTYAHLVRANMNSQEIIFLLYNGVGKDVFLEFKQRIELFTMLQDVAHDTSIREDVKALYDPKAYTD